MKKIVTVIIGFTLMVSCSSIDIKDLGEEHSESLYEICDVNDPLNELNWLIEMKNQIDNNTEDIQYSIFKASYNGNTVFYKEVTDTRFEVTISHINIWNCKGKIVKVFNWENSADFKIDITNIVKLYSNPIEN